jgi:esterase/lipase superfamily enzyme
LQITVFYATNRGHEGAERFKPLRYGARFSTDGMENLRFGRVQFEADAGEVNKLLARTRKHTGPGDGQELQGYFGRMMKKKGNARIDAYEEVLPRGTVADPAQPQKLGSLAMFSDLQADMQQGKDMLLLIHGFNVNWEEAVATAAAFEAVLNRARAGVAPAQPVRVVLFTWPSDGQAIPWASYKSDRADASGTSGALGRALLKMRDYLHQVAREARSGEVRKRELRESMKRMPAAEVERAVAQLEVTELCRQRIHLLAHSMGNYVLQNALQRLWDFSPGEQLPRLFDQVFLCAPDVDDDVLEPGKPMERLHQIAQSIQIYHNHNDAALRISDFTKSNPDRLGQRGAARPQLLHQKISQVDCSAMVSGLTQHSYYTDGLVTDDIRRAIEQKSPDERGLRAVGMSGKAWKMLPA